MKIKNKENEMIKWEKRRLGEIVKIVGGGTPSKSNKSFYNGDIPWASVRDLNDFELYDTEFKITADAVANSSTNIIPKGNIIIATRVGLGKVVLNEIDTAINQDLRGLILTDKVERNFLYYFFLWKSEFIQNSGTGATVKGVRLDFIKGLVVPLPPLPEQRRIVTKLDDLFSEIDAALALIDENIEKAEALKLSVLNEEFGKFGVEYYKPLKKIMRVINGRAYKRKEMLLEGNYPILRVGNFFTNREWYYSDMELEKDKYCVPGDLLYAWSASFGPKIWEGPKSIFHYHIWKLEPLIHQQVSRKFMFYQLKYDTDKIKLESGRGVGMIHLTKGGIEKRKFILPSIDVQKAFVKKMDKIFMSQNKLIQNYIEKRANLEALKASLLHQAFTGKL